MNKPLSPRQVLLDLYQTGIRAVNGCSVVHEFLGTQNLSRSMYALAIGKAADAMMHGAYKAIGDRIVKSLIVYKYESPDKGDVNSTKVCNYETCQRIASRHPIPDSLSLQAGEQVMQFVRSIPRQAQLLVLISGGTSSLVEVLPQGMGINELAQLNQWLLASGFTISEINQLRRQCSLIKGGKLLQHIGAGRTLCLYLSDVESGSVMDIGSGICAIPAGDQIDLALLKKLDTKLRQLIERFQLAVRQTKFPRIQTQVEHYIVADLGQAKQAVAEQAQRLGYSVQCHSEYLKGDAVVQGERIAKYLLESMPGISIWGGETTVVLPRTPGRGGRCQSLALSAARYLTGHDPIYLLAAGTDGGDGTGIDAGAIVDHTTVEQARRLGISDVCGFLQDANAGAYLQKIGALIRCGDTQTNVTDLIIALKLAQSS